MDRSTGNTYNVSKEQIASGCARRRFRAYPEYKNSGVEWLDQIPSHWNVKRLKYIASINDEVLAETTDPQYEMTYVDIGGVDQYQGIVNREKYVFETAPSRARRKVREGDVIISTVRTYLRAIAQIEAPESDLIVSTGFAVIRPGPIFSSHYAAYALRASYFIEKIVANSVGVSYPAIDASKISRFPVAFPELTKQESIADFLDRETAKIDALIAKKERLIELLQEKRTALITQAVTKGLDPNVSMKDSGIEWLGKIPAHWECLALSRVTFARCDGPFGSGLRSEHYSESGLRVVRLQNIGSAEFCDADRAYINEEYGSQLGDHSVLPGDLLIAGLGDEAHPVGRACVAPEHIVPAMVKADCFRFRLDGRLLLARFAGYQLSATAAAAAGALSTGATRSRLNLTAMATRKVALPPLSEQAAIVSFLDRGCDENYALIAKIQVAIDRLHEYRTALISAAVTGKIDVRKA